MLSSAVRDVTDPRQRRAHPKRVRDLQRLVHLTTAAVVVAYVYLTPAPDSAAALAVRWFALPVLVASGIGLWKWTTLRRLWRGRTRARTRAHA
jgi:hypothetical protein